MPTTRFPRLLALLLLAPALLLGLASPGAGQSGYQLRTVVIDPGHGGKDPGALGLISYEKDLTLAISLRLGQYIRDNFPGVRVVYTRETDQFVELVRRSEIANEHQADLLISVHINASLKPHVTGTSTYVMGLNRLEQNLDVAMRENSVILQEENYQSVYKGFDPRSPESHILLSLAQNMYLEQSLLMAGLCQKHFSQVGRVNRGVKQEAMIVLWNAAMPGVLVETGFITNPEEERWLNTRAGQDYLASSIFRAFRDYKHALEEGGMAALTQTLAGINPRVFEGDLPALERQALAPPTPRAATPSRAQPPAQAPAPPPAADEVFFAVQLAASPTPLPTGSGLLAQFQGVEQQLSQGTYRYFYARGKDFQQVLQAQRQARAKVPDAFVVAFRGTERLSVEQARRLLGQ